MITMKSNAEEFKRLRLRVDALLLSPGDKSGPLLNELSAVHIRQVKRAYSTQGASTGSDGSFVLGGVSSAFGWPPLSPRYKAWKKKHFPGRKILVRSGTTRETFTSPGNAGFFKEWTAPDTYAFGGVSSIQWRHETGTGEGEQKLPVRSIMAKTQADYTAFVARYRTFYLKRVRQVLRHL